MMMMLRRFHWSEAESGAQFALANEASKRHSSMAAERITGYGDLLTITTMQSLWRLQDRL